MAATRAFIGLGLFLLLTTSPDLQDKEPQICTKFNKCFKYTEKTKKKCTECNRRRIYDEYAFCTSCARKSKVCGRCGLGKTAQVKKGSGKIEDAVKSIKAATIRKFLTYYASDELEGRLAGHPGNQKAINWIKENLEKWGLKPGNKGDWFFPFEVGGFKTSNVMAMIPGSDERLKNEVVIAGAHCDHVGKSGQPNKGRKTNSNEPKDGIWNGADDNGSGSTTLLEVARAIGEGGIRFKRTVIIMWFNAEEWGLVGANRYCQNPTFPLDKTVAMINMDMVGRNPGQPYSLGCSGNLEQWRSLINKANQGVNCDVKIGKGSGSRTDQGAFVKKGVASAGFFGGMHPDYHCQSDHVDKINFEKMEKCAKLTLRMLYELGNMTSPPSR